MIKKIDIAKFGLFVDYKWIQNVGDENHFNRLNIIYGRNYSGKTTLSRIFRCIEKQELHKKYKNGQFTLTNVEDNTVTQSTLAYTKNVRVYNTDFVKDNLSWLHDDEKGEIVPFTLLGSRNVMAELRIKAIDKELGSIDTEGLLFKYHSENNKYGLEVQKLAIRKDQLDTKLKVKANSEIKINNYFIKQGKTYNVSNIQSEIDYIINSKTNFRLDNHTQDLYKKQIDENEKSAIGEVSLSKSQFEQDIEKVKLLLEKKITLNNTIQDLLSNSILQEWVNKGREYHRDKRESCAFCGGDIGPVRWKELDRVC